MGLCEINGQHVIELKQSRLKEIKQLIQQN